MLVIRAEISAQSDILRRIMPFLYPTHSTLHTAFSSQSPFARRPADANVSKPSKIAPRNIFNTWSAVDDAKSKAGQLTAEAQRELEKASLAVRAKTGQIELYSLNYYAGKSETPAI